MTDEHPDENQNHAAERSVAQAPPTGDARVDDAVAGLSRLQGRPAEEHVAVLEEVHGRLRDILDDLAPSGPDAPAGGSGGVVPPGHAPAGGSGGVVPPGQQ